MSDPFSPQFVARVVAHVNTDHRREMLELVHGLAGQIWADDAELLHADPLGLDLLVRGGGREQRLRVPFDAPLERPNQVRPALIALIERARRALPESDSTDDETA